MKKIILLLVVCALPFFSVFAGEPSNDWRSAKLYGNDNEYASLRKVNIFKQDGEYRVYIHNQFRFECQLSFDEKGNPAQLSGCKSREEPRPICRDIHNPNSVCARGSNCFQTLPETNPRCYNNWAVKEAAVKLSCVVRKKEHVCRGKYTLINNEYQSKAYMTIAGRR
ncbi:MAG: hypothetical protein OEZ39_16555 [Gammaproteobacteria bacterium]|nr:hypothetical protein [Gammaproteobacteria bacterium]